MASESDDDFFGADDASDADDCGQELWGARADMRKAIAAAATVSLFAGPTHLRRCSPLWSEGATIGLPSAGPAGPSARTRWAPVEEQESVAAL